MTHNNPRWFCKEWFFTVCFKFYMDAVESTPLLNRLTIQNNPANQKSDLYINDVLFSLNTLIQVRVQKPFYVVIGNDPSHHVRS